MNLSAVANIVGHLPNMQIEQAQKIAAFIQKKKISRVLELGFCHGVSTSYFAHILKHLNNGHIDTIDLHQTLNLKPNIHDLLEKCDLAEQVTIWTESRSYTWRLMKFLENNQYDTYDLCYIDGAHNWYDDGFAFLLVDKLLKPGGWIIFDDLNWTYNTSQSLKNTPMVLSMDEEEKSIPHVRKIIDILVKKHPNYTTIIEDGDWVFAQKNHNAIGGANLTQTKVIQEKVIIREKIGISGMIYKILTALRRKLKT